MNEDRLTFYFYNDGLSRSERKAVARALAADSALAVRYEQLARQLDRIGDARAPLPPSDMVQRWHDRLDRAVDKDVRKAARPSLHSWSFMLGCAVAVVLAIGVGLYLGGDDTETSATNDVVGITVRPGQPSSKAFLRGLELHLRESESGLVAIPTSAVEQRRVLVMNFIEQNRLFERAAEQNASEHLARVLRAFELILLKLAAEDISTEEAESLTTKLLFELNVVRTKLAHDASNDAQII